MDSLIIGNYRLYEAGDESSGVGIVALWASLGSVPQLQINNKQLGSLALIMTNLVLTVTKLKPGSIKDDKASS